jgi:hypothetical protein
MCAGLGCLPNLRARMSRTLSHHLVISLRIRASHNTLGVKASLQLWDAKTQHLCVVQMQVMKRSMRRWARFNARCLLVRRLFA